MTGQRQHIATFLQALHRNIGPTRAVQFRALRDRDIPQERWMWDWKQLDDVLDDLLQLNARGWNIFVGIQPRGTLAGGERENIVASTVLAVDFDLVARGGSWEAIMTELDRLSFPRPPIVVNSGNGRHGYWPIDEASIDLAEEVGKRLCALCASDHVWNASRVMRLPGTVNWKNPPRWCWAEKVETASFSLGEVDDRLTRLGLPPLQEDAPSTPIQVEVPASLAELLSRLSRGMQDVVTTGQHSYPSNSEADWAVAVALFAAGCTLEMARAVFQSCAIGSRKVASSPLSYLERTLARAKSQADRDRAERMRGLSLPSPPFEQVGDGRWAIRQLEAFSAKMFWR